jgi:hypothetical protein
VNNDGLHAETQVQGTIGLSAGSHSIRVRYFQQYGDQILQVSYAPPGDTLRPLPANGALSLPQSAYQIGVWGPVIAWPHIPISMANLPDGRILTFSSTEVDAFPSGTEFTNRTRKRSRTPINNSRHVLRGLPRTAGSSRRGATRTTHA